MSKFSWSASNATGFILSRCWSHKSPVLARVCPGALEGRDWEAGTWACLGEGGRAGRAGVQRGRSRHCLAGAGASEKSRDPRPRRPEALSWGRSLPGDRVSRTVRTGVCSRPRSRSQHPGEFLLAVEGLEGRLAPGFGRLGRSGGEKGAPGCAPPQLCGRTWEPVEGAGGTSSLTSPPLGAGPSNREET